ncbi:MAG: hypothetical protein JXR14_00865 [Paracoccaceae bacterium]
MAASNGVDLVIDFDGAVVHGIGTEGPFGCRTANISETKVTEGSIGIRCDNEFAETLVSVDRYTGKYKELVTGKPRPGLVPPFSIFVEGTCRKVAKKDRKQKF